MPRAKKTKSPTRTKTATKAKTAQAKTAPPRKGRGRQKVLDTVTNMLDLAGILKCSRMTISNMKRHPDAPKCMADGRYDVTLWKEFKVRWDEEIVGGRTDRENKSFLEAQRLEVVVQREELKLEQLRGTLMSVDEVCEVVVESFKGMVEALKSLENELAPQMAGANAAQAKLMMRKYMGLALEKYALGGAFKKKVFWETVYAKFQSLQAKYNPGNGLNAM